MRCIAIALILSLAACACTQEAILATAPAAMPRTGDPVEGLRVATRVGCNGCHGEDGSGRKLWGVDGKFQLYSSNLTQRREQYDDRGIATLLRTGKTHDGHFLYGMPTVMFQHLSDQETRDITAWLRSLPAVPDHETQQSWFSDDVARQIKDGTYPDQVSERADPLVHAQSAPPTEALDLGKHLAMTSCSECHGPALDGWGNGDPAPPLAIAKAYSLEQFTRLMRTGITLSGKESTTGLMTEVGRGRFPAMTDAEVRSLKAYLDSR